MWVGQQLADGLDFWGFLGSLILGGIILGIYTGLLGYVGAKTGLSLDLLSQRAFGEKGSYLPSAMTSFTQIGWFGVGSFVSGGTATPNFARFAKNGKAGAITTVVAFFIGNSLMFFFGAVSSIFVGGNDIFEVMVRLNLFYLAVLVLGLNIWTTNDNALYTAGLGLANIFHQRKKPMVLLSGIIGTVASVWLYYNFCGWLNILNCTLPPVGMILVLAYFMNKEDFETDQPKLKTVDWFAVAGVILGAIVANLLHWGIASINGMVVAAVCYCVGQSRKQKKITITPLACFSLSSWKHVQGFLFLLIRVIMYA
ncbi:MAG: cytosine permease [Lachnospiraceae bacterium]